MSENILAEKILSNIEQKPGAKFGKYTGYYIQPQRLDEIDWFENYSENIPKIDILDLIDIKTDSYINTLIQAGTEPERIMNIICEQYVITNMIASLK